MTGIAAHVIGNSTVKVETLQPTVNTVYNVAEACAAVNFANQTELCELYTYTVSHDMKKTPEPTHDLNYKHSEALRKIKPEDALKTALERGNLLADQCKSILMCVAAAIGKYGPKRWLQDTGSGNDLISKKEVDPKSKRIPLSDPLHLQTANDIISVRERVRMKVKATKETIEPLLLRSTPAVMSVGFRCVEKVTNLHGRHIVCDLIILYQTRNVSICTRKGTVHI